MHLYPLRFKEILRNYSFGTRRIPTLFPAKQGFPPDHRIAETWEVCDRPPESSEVINGPLAGHSLHQLIENQGAELLGTAMIERFGARFPLLIKFLDAGSVLSEQAHHSDELAAARGIDDSGKTEAWYMLDTRPGSAIRCGNVPGLTPERLTQALLDGTSRECMQEQAVRPGDAFLLYAGTMHYSAGGQVFYEIMQNSDVYIGLGPFKPGVPDSEKRARAAAALEGVHIEENFDCRTRPVIVDEEGARRTVILACEHFALERLDLDGTCDVSPDGSRFEVFSQIEGESRIRWPGGEEHLRAGNTCLVPASLRTVSLHAKGSAVLRAYVPDLARDIVEPLRARGVADSDIERLGGVTVLNPLRKVLAMSDSRP